MLRPECERHCQCALAADLRERGFKVPFDPRQQRRRPFSANRKALLRCLAADVGFKREQFRDPI